jgi:hypothetical protein
MKINKGSISKFRTAFYSDAGIKLNDEKAQISLGNLVNFFDLLWQFDQEDKEKMMKMKGFKNESKYL